MLTWVCQEWRQIVLTSPLGLNIRLYCTYGTPVLKTLDCWPALPIMVQYGGSPDLVPPSPEDDDSIIAVLQQSGRVSSVSLTITRSLHDKLSAISEPLLELEDLTLLSPDNVQLTLPSTFLWGSRLRTLHSTGIAFPSLLPILLPCQDLVDIQLHEIPSAGYFSPDEFANALSGTTQVRSLSLHFLSFPPRRNFLYLPPPLEERIVLPTLTFLQYRGTSKFLDSFVARIDAPRLENINITFFFQPTMDASELAQFIQRTEMQTSLIQADVETSAHDISISFTDSSASTPLRLQISCKQLDWQLFSMAQVCDQFSPFLCRIENLGVNTIKSSSGQDEVVGERWLQLLFAISGTKKIRMAASSELVTRILQAFPPTNGSNTTVLPGLCHIRIEDPLVMNVQLWDAFQSSRRLCGHPVELQISCHICEHSVTQLRVLQRHLKDVHGYGLMCSYCGDFECNSGKNDLFPEHLQKKHPEVARNDALISSRAIYASELRRVVERHSSLRASENTTPFVSAPSPPVAIARPSIRDTDIKAPWAED